MEVFNSIIELQSLVRTPHRRTTADDMPIPSSPHPTRIDATLALMQNQCLIQTCYMGRFPQTSKFPLPKIQALKIFCIKLCLFAPQPSQFPPPQRLGIWIKHCTEFKYRGNRRKILYQVNYRNLAARIQDLRSYMLQSILQCR